MLPAPLAKARLSSDRAFSEETDACPFNEGGDGGTEKMGAWPSKVRDWAEERDDGGVHEGENVEAEANGSEYVDSG